MGWAEPRGLMCGMNYWFRPLEIARTLFFYCDIFYFFFRFIFGI